MWKFLILISRAFFFFFSYSGLPQDHKATDGLGYGKETAGEQLLLEWKRSHPRYQYNVQQLLHLQQGGRRCCRYGTSTGKVVPYKGTCNKISNNN